MNRRKIARLAALALGLGVLAPISGAQAAPPPGAPPFVSDVPQLDRSKVDPVPPEVANENAQKRARIGPQIGRAHV